MAQRNKFSWILVFLTVLALGAIMVPVIPVKAQTDWYVDGSSGTNDGSHGTGPSSLAFKTIQYAINDSRVSAGDTIKVAPGTYNESIVVNKSLILLGAQADVDPRPSLGVRSGPESIIESSGTVLSIQAHNVVINGFTFKSNINNSTLNVVEAVDQQHPQIIYNIVYNTNPGGSSNEGIKVRRSYDSGAVVSYNYVYDIPKPGDAINFDSVNNGIITHNEVRNISSENAAIYVYNSQNTTIEDNIVDGTTQNDGIKLGNKNGSNASNVGGSITKNIVKNTKQDGISVYMSDVLVEGNDVSYSTSENGAIYVAYGVSNITIHCNDIRDNTLSTGKWGNPAGILIGTDVNVSTVNVNCNNIWNNDPYGVTNKARGSLDATGNWWGYPSGPGGEGPGSGDKVSSNVIYDPWLTQRACAPPPVIHVKIDIKPGSETNPINLGSKGVTPVAILSTDDFDASNVNPTTVKFADASPVRWTLCDVDGDGLLDMLLHFNTQDLKLSPTSTEAKLTGETIDGTPIEGTDVVKIVPRGG